MRFLTGFLLGALGTTASLGYLFVTTTVSYRSTLFPGELVRISRSRGILITPARPATAGITP